MEQKYGIIAIAGICLVVLLMGIMKQKVKVAATFFCRAAIGIVGIGVANKVLESQGIAIAVGVNPVSAVTIGTLGISGFVLLYAIMVYQCM